MTTDQLSETPEAVTASPDPDGRDWRRATLYASVAAVSLTAYTALLYFVLSRSTAKVYGFAVSYDPRTLIELAVQICPMLAAIFMVLLSRMRDAVIRSATQGILRTRPLWRSQSAGTVATVGVNLFIAAVTTLATAIAIVTVYGPLDGSMNAITSIWVAAELVYDITLIGIFTSFLYALTGRFWVTLLLFIAYIIAVIVAGPRWGITSYIGFGSGVPIMLTTYSAIPLYDGASWLFRGYWTCVTVLMLCVLHEFDTSKASLFGRIRDLVRSGERSFVRPVAAISVLVAVCVLAAGSLVRLQVDGRAKYEAPSQPVLDAALRGDNGNPHSRLHLSHFDVRLKYTPQVKTIAVEGVQVFHPEAQAIRTAYFQMPDAFVPERLRIDGAGNYETRLLGKYVQITFKNSLKPGRHAQVRYTGLIRSAGQFDLSVQAKVLGNAFFLTDSDVLLTPRSAACLIAADAQPRTGTAANPCGSGENFLLTDLAVGRTTVIAPRSLDLLTAGVRSDGRVTGDDMERVFTTSTPGLARFILACGRFSKTVLESKETQTRVHVYRAEGTTDGNAPANVAQSVLSFYKSFWPEYPHRDLHIIETPAPAGEAVAFDGVIAISDKIIGSRDPFSGSPSTLLEFVLAHEIAHQWWGYRLIPARSPGWRFILESFPQFAAYKYLSNRQILREADAIRRETKRYESARKRLGDSDVPLLRAEAADEVAYNKGPLALLRADGLLEGNLMARLGGLLRSRAAGTRESTTSEDVAAALLEQITPEKREIARPLFYGPGLER